MLIDPKLMRDKHTITLLIRRYMNLKARTQCKTKRLTLDYRNRAQLPPLLFTDLRQPRNLRKCI